jgi:hypothetical protein
MKGRGEDTVLAHIKRELREAERHATIKLTPHPNRSDRYNKSPDFIVDLEVTIPLFPSERPLRVKVPLLIEVEAGAGFEAGLQDLERYVTRVATDRSHAGPPIILPFPIATEANRGRQRELIRTLPIKFVAFEMPIPDPDPEAP